MRRITLQGPKTARALAACTRQHAAPLAAAVSALALLAAPAPALASHARQSSPRGHYSVLAPPKPPASATLEQCMSSATADQRSATFAGEMTAVPGTQRMQMSVQVLERLPGDVSYHLVDAPDLGVWRSSAPGVQSYKYLRQVTNLAAPAFYRANIRFRWLAHGRTIDALELHTRRCDQPLLLAEPVSG
jgi:hypothetical protein